MSLTRNSGSVHALAPSPFLRNYFDSTTTTPTANWVTQTTVAPNRSLQATATPSAPSAITIAALDALLPVPYGVVQLPALLVNVLIFQPHIIFFVLWGEGEVSSIDSILLNDLPLPYATQVNTYLGSLTQTVDPVLAIVYPGLLLVGPTWANALPGVAYSVIRIPYDLVTAPPKFTANVHGRKIYDPRLDSTNGGSGSQRLNNPATWTWSNNASLVLADFLTTPATSWGGGYTMVWSSVIAAANANDVVLGVAPNTEKTRVCNIVIDRQATVTSWKDTLRTAAGCFIAENQRMAKLIPDIPGSVTQAFKKSDGTLLGITNLKTLDLTNLPTIIDLGYTDTSALPWKDALVTVKRPGVDAGTAPWRRSSVPMQWIHSLGQANREAVERVNKLWLRSPVFTAEVFDEGLRTEVGDTVTFDDDDYGFSDLTCKVATATPTDHGTWMLDVVRDDANCYSTTVQGSAATPPTNLPNPNIIPALTGVEAVEDVYYVSSGFYSSRFKISWNDPAVTVGTVQGYPYMQYVFVQIRQAGIVKDSALVPRGTNLYVSLPMTENLSYDISAQIISSVGASGPATAITLTNNGKSALPSDVPSLTGYWVNGDVRLTWLPATDLDLTGYELRYNTSAYGTATDLASLEVQWTGSTFITDVLVPGGGDPLFSRQYQTTLIPVGSHRFLIKAFDSVRSPISPVGQFSLNAAYLDLIVQVKPSDQININLHKWIAATLVNAVQITVPPGSANTNWTTDYGTTWAALFPAAMSTYTDFLFRYYDLSGATPSGSIVTDTFDLGSMLFGTLLNTMVYIDGLGVSVVTLQTSPDGSTWTDHVGVTSWTGTTRYVRGRIVAGVHDTVYPGSFYVTSLGA